MTKNSISEEEEDLKKALADDLPENLIQWAEELERVCTTPEWDAVFQPNPLMRLRDRDAHIVSATYMRHAAKAIEWLRDFAGEGWNS